MLIPAPSLSFWRFYCSENESKMNILSVEIMKIFVRNFFSDSSVVKNKVKSKCMIS